jgi:ATP-dependent RNA helicase DeaD
VLPHAPYLIARFLAPALERVTADADATQLLIITPDGDTTLAIAEAARSLSDRSAAPVVPITSAGRGARLLASRVVPALAATPGTIVSLLKTSAVKLDAVRTVVIAWADELYATREGESLEVVLGELSKDAARVVVADRMTPDVEALVERHLRRASRQGVTAADDPAVASLPIRYVTTSQSGRSAAFRRLLDDLDPPSVIVLASGAGAADEARAAVASLGYEGDASIRVETTSVAEQAALVVFYDLPATAEEVVKVAATEPAQVVALVTPRQVPALRRLTSGAVEPIDVSRAAAKARAKDERLRAALRAELQSGFPARELMALEPLLSEFDGVEIAAAALRLMERERTDDRTRRVEAEKAVERTVEKPVERAERSAEPRAERGAERGGDRPPRTTDRPVPRATRSDAAFTRVFLTIGERDGVRAGDLVGAITGESGITGDRVGKLDIRDGHTVAEIASGDVEMVVEKLNGISLKGKRITARVDDRPAGRSREGGRDAGREGGRDSRPPRRSGPSAGGRGGFRDAGRSGPREGARGASREGGRSSFGAGRDRPSRGPARGPARGPSRGPSRDRPGSDRGPRRDDDRPRARAGFTDRSDEGRVPRATREREEWTDRADAVRNARRPRRDQT